MFKRLALRAFAVCATVAGAAVLFALFCVPPSNAAFRLQGWVPPWPYFRNAADHTANGPSSPISNMAVTSIGSGSNQSPVLMAGPAGTGWRGSIVVGNDGGTTGSVQSIPLVSGTGTAWSQSLDGPVRGCPAIGNLSGFDDVYVATAAGTFYRYDHNCSLRTSVSVGQAVEASPVLDESNALAYVVTTSGKVCAYSTSSFGLSLVWSATYGSGSAMHAGPALSGDVLYTANDSGTVFAIWRFSGTYNGTTHSAGDVFWSASTSGAVKTAPMVANGMVYVGSDDDSVYAFDAATGAQDWSYATSGTVRSSAALSSDGLSVYIGSSDGYLYSLDASTGAANWSYQAAGPVLSSPAVLSDGRVTFGCANGSAGKVYILSTSGTADYTGSLTSPVNSSPAAGWSKQMDGTQVGKIFFTTDGGTVYKLTGTNA